MTYENAWLALGIVALLTLVGIESKLGKIADELTILRKNRTNLACDEIPLKVQITKMPKE